MSPIPPNVLASRYASEPMRRIWSPEDKVIRERRWWIAVMRAQMESSQSGASRPTDLGLTPDVVADYQRVAERVDLDSIDARERVTRHDVKARIEEFNALAGHQHAHKGMTSRDLTENVELWQLRDALRLIRDRAVATLAVIARRASEFADLPITGRSHNVPAQITTVGKRIANVGEECLAAFDRIEHTIANLRLRGIKGPVGTQQDMADLIGGENLATLENRIAQLIGWTASTSGSPSNQAGLNEPSRSPVMDCVGQVYPRSIDFDVITTLCQWSSGPANFARTLRLMAGGDLATEGFRPGQVGSSAMPHKMNARSAERIGGFNVILRGYVTMAGGLLGDQWNEGDVSCSVVRRVALPDAFFAADGQLETFLTVLNDFGVYPAVIQRELDRYLPFLATTKVMMAAVKSGVGRETAHEVIKQHAVAAALRMRESDASSDSDASSESGSANDRPTGDNQLIGDLAADDRLPMDADTIRDIIGRPIEFIGTATTQVQAIVSRIESIVGRHPEAAAYQPGDIL